MLETPKAESQGGIEALIELEGFSLVRRGVDDATVTVHRLVQEITREREQADTHPPHADAQAPSTATTPLAPAGLMCALCALDEALTDDVTEQRAWQEWTALQPHVATAVGFADDFKIAEPTARLSRGLGTFLFNKAVYSEAEHTLKHALALDEHTHGLEHASVAHDLVNLSKVLRETDRLTEAEKCAVRALQINEAITPQDPVAVAATLIELGEVLFSQRRLAEREPLYRRALSIREQHFGPVHRSVAESMNNLASALQDIEQTAEAERLYRRSLEIGAQVLPANDRELAIWTNNLASLFEQTERHEEAEAAYRCAISILEAGPVPDHPVLATLLLNVAALLDRSGRCDETHSARLRALEIRSRYFGPNHAHSLATISAVVQSLFAKNEFAKALEFCQRLLAASPARTEAENADVLTALDHVAALLESKNELNLAEEYRRIAGDARERILGANHADTINALNSLAKLQERRADWNGAEATYQKALAQDRVNIMVLGNYAFLLQNTRRDFPKAHTLYQQALEADPNDAVNLTNFAGLCVCMSDLCAAEELLQRAWAQVHTKPDCYSARTFFLRAAITVLKQGSPRLFLGQLKTAFASPTPHPQWNATSVLQHLQEKLSPLDAEFFRALHVAVVDSNAVSTLDRFSCWRDAVPVALDAQWPTNEATNHDSGAQANNSVRNLKPRIQP